MTPATTDAAQEEFLPPCTHKGRGLRYNVQGDKQWAECELCGAEWILSNPQPALPLSADDLERADTERLDWADQNVTSLDGIYQQNGGWYIHCNDGEVILCGETFRAALDAARKESA